MTTNTTLKRNSPGDPSTVPGYLKPEAIIGSTSRRTSELEQEGSQGTVRAATAVVQASIYSQAHLLVLESTPYLLKSGTWTVDLSPLLSTTGYCWKAVEMSAQQVGIPSTKRRTFVGCVRNHLSAKGRLIKSKPKLTNMRVQPVMLGEFVGREGSYFLSRKQGEQRIFPFEDPILSLTQGHILEEKPPRSGYQFHLPDEGSLEDTQELLLADFAKIATGLEAHVFPPTLNRVVNCLLATDGCTIESSHNPTGPGTEGLVT